MRRLYHNTPLNKKAQLVAAPRLIIFAEGHVNQARKRLTSKVNSHIVCSGKYVQSVEKENALKKGTREVQCPNCLPEVTIITIKVTVETFGKRVRIKCRKCLTTFITEPIPVPPAEEAPKQTSGGFPFSDTFGDAFDFLKPKK